MLHTEDFQYVQSKMQDEGFDYCFIHYSDFEEIKDEQFHILRKKYIQAQKELKKYILDKANTESDDI